MISFRQLGAGRIGAIHVKNLAGHPGARLRIVVDPDRAAADRLAGPMEQARRVKCNETNTERLRKLRRLRAGPMVRIRFPPAASHLRT